MDEEAGRATTATVHVEIVDNSTDRVRLVLNEAETIQTENGQIHKAEAFGLPTESLEPGETPLMAAIRAIKEEACFAHLPEDLAEQLEPLNNGEPIENSNGHARYAFRWTLSENALLGEAGPNDPEGQIKGAIWYSKQKLLEDSDVLIEFFPGEELTVYHRHRKVLRFAERNIALDEPSGSHPNTETRKLERKKLQRRNDNGGFKIPPPPSRGTTWDRRKKGYGGGRKRQAR